MIQTLPALSESYLADETAWLDAMAELVRTGAHTDLDYANLGEYLQDAADRDRREVKNCLGKLLLQILAFEYQPKKRTRRSRVSIFRRQQELTFDLSQNALRRHAESSLQKLYLNAVRCMCIEPCLPSELFPTKCPYSLDELLTYEAAE